MPAPTLAPPPDQALILRGLGVDAARFVVEVVAECASTNDSIRTTDIAPDTALHVLIAHRQTAGRGRRGRSWESVQGQSLTFSCAWRLPNDASAPVALPLTVGLALAEAIESLGVSQLTLKWPNDVLLDGRKVAGILVEVTGSQTQRKAIIGIGLNLLRTHEYPLPDGATALSDHLPTAPEPETVLATILLRLDARLADHRKGGFTALREAWQQRDAFAGRQVSIRGDDIEHLGVCEGVADDGALLLRTGQTTTRILSGDVSLRAAT